MMDYFHHKKGKTHVDTTETPVLTEEDEAFLQRIASEGTPPPLPARPQDLFEAGSTRGNDAQIALMAGAQNIPLPPDEPDTPVERSLAPQMSHKSKGKEKLAEGSRKMWSYLRRDSRDSKRKNQELAATDLQSAAEGLKAADAHPNGDHTVSDPEAKKEEEEMTQVLEQLNLAAVNNRVFSISKKSQELLRKFTLVLKDLVNGVPTAYDDLESLLTNSEHQLQRSYAHLPSFLQSLIASLPHKLTSSIGPEILAAAAEKQGLKSEYLQTAAGVASGLGMKVKVPSLKDLVMKPGAVATMLRSIMNFLRLRFPAFIGMNVLWSLALFVLLFVFWYCHKRGKEVRLEKERLLSESEIAALDAQVAAEPPATYQPSSHQPTGAHTQAQMRTTTAPEGAPIEDVRAGMAEARVGEKEDTEEDTASAPYAPGGSLAKELAKEKQSSSGPEEVQVREVEADSILGRAFGKRSKAEKRAMRIRESVSEAPLDRQESCVVC